MKNPFYTNKRLQRAASMYYTARDLQKAADRLRALTEGHTMDKALRDELEGMAFDLEAIGAVTMRFCAKPEHEAAEHEATKKAEARAVKINEDLLRVTLSGWLDDCRKAGRDPLEGWREEVAHRCGLKSYYKSVKPKLDRLGITTEWIEAYLSQKR